MQYGCVVTDAWSHIIGENIDDIHDLLALRLVCSEMCGAVSAHSRRLRRTHQGKGVMLSARVLDVFPSADNAFVNYSGLSTKEVIPVRAYRNLVVRINRGHCPIPTREQRRRWGRGRSQPTVALEERGPRGFTGFQEPASLQGDRGFQQAAITRARLRSWRWDWSNHERLVENIPDLLAAHAAASPAFPPRRICFINHCDPMCRTLGMRASTVSVFSDAFDGNVGYKMLARVLTIDPRIEVRDLEVGREVWNME